MVQLLFNISSTYNHRYAVAFYYPLSSWAALQPVTWSAKYVFDDDVIRYISIENKKKDLIAASSVDAVVKMSGDSSSSVSEMAGSRYESGPSILVHTSVPFGIEFKDSDETVVYQTVLDHLNSVLPNLGDTTFCCVFDCLLILIVITSNVFFSF